MLPDGPLREALTFDDVLLVPADSDVIPKDVDVRTQLTPGISLAIPIVSSAMDTVTEAATAICMARDGGIGIVHKNYTIPQQALEVTKVKKAESGVVVNPVTVGPDQKLAVALELMKQHEISGLPVVASDGRPVGILTNRDIRFERNLEQPVSAMMTKKLITIAEGTSVESAKELLHRNRIEKLLVIDGGGFLKGLVTIKDIEKAQAHPFAAKDDFGRLRVGAAVGVGPDRDERVDALLKAGADVICIDTAHGHSRAVVQAVADVRRNFPKSQIIAGNVATGEAALALAKAGADAIKVGIGPGSICTTRVVAGVGVPQITAINDCAKARGLDERHHRRGRRHQVFGRRRQGARRRRPQRHDRQPLRRHRRGARRDHPVPGAQLQGVPGDGVDRRHARRQPRPLLPGRGDERSQAGPRGDRGAGAVPRAAVAVALPADRRRQSGMGYTGCRTIDELRTKARFVRATAMGLRESHVHDVIITKEAPNYRVEQ